MVWIRERTFWDTSWKIEFLSWKCCDGLLALCEGRRGVVLEDIFFLWSFVPCNIYGKLGRQLLVPQNVEEFGVYNKVAYYDSCRWLSHMKPYEVLGIRKKKRTRTASFEPVATLLFPMIRKQLPLSLELINWFIESLTLRSSRESIYVAQSASHTSNRSTKIY
jgi:hypothetical protein